MNGRTPTAPPDPAARERLRDRLIEQVLLSEEAEKASSPAVPRDQAAEELAGVRMIFGGEEAFAATLRSIGLNKEQALERLARRDIILHLIDRRLRPDAWVGHTEIETYYNKTFVPAYRKDNQGTPPALSEVEDRIREILTQGRINNLLGQWLEDLKTSHRVGIHSF